MMHPNTSSRFFQLKFGWLAFLRARSFRADFGLRGLLIASSVVCLWLHVSPVAFGQDQNPEDNATNLTTSAWTYADEFSFELWADGALIAYPTAFSFDDQGRLFVAEHFRNRKGTEDDRMHKYWMDDDFAVKTVEDRLAMYKKWAAKDKKPLSFYSEHADKISVVSDTDDDGRADHSNVVAEFGDVLDGALAGVLARPDGVWVTNIPHLWKLTGIEKDGVAKNQDKVFSGFGVKVSLHGHDMHGIIDGPDGRLYWSIGDRGYHVRTKQGQILEDAYSGAVFRCERDGSGLEIFATGLRNPQELVFDDFGNLFTVDNDADGDDRARVLYLVEGGEYGWRMSYQWPDEHRIQWAPFVNRPWWRESVWEKRPANRAMYVLPPMGHLTEGPCGLTQEPGLSTFSEKFRGAFFVADFQGSAASSHLWSFRVRPEGAGFLMSASDPVISGILPTDIEFGHDGCLYVGDYVEGWAGNAEGRIWKMKGGGSGEQGSLKASRLAEVQMLLEQPTESWTSQELIDLLGHSHKGVRQRAQFESALRPNMVTPLTQAASENMNRMTRLHALRALGQMQRSGARVLKPLISLLADPDEEVQVQMARLLRDTPISDAAESLRELLLNGSLRAASSAAMAIGSMGDGTTLPVLREKLAADSSRDDFLRHAVVLAFTEIAKAGHQEDLLLLSDDENSEVRLAVLLALRQLRSSDVASFLTDEDPRLVLAAAQAINDVPIPEGMPALADMIGQWKDKDVDLGLRILNANFRLGGPERASRIANLAADTNAPELLRQDALAMLAEWPQPSPRDRTMGTWQPLKTRDRSTSAALAAEIVPKLIRNSPAAVRMTAVALAQHYEIDEATNELLEFAGDDKLKPVDRAKAIRSLAFLEKSIVEDLTTTALTDSSPAVRSAARDLLAASSPDEAISMYATVLESGKLIEQREALRQLGRMKQDRAMELVVQELGKLVSEELPPELELDALLAGEDAAAQHELSGRERIKRRAQIAPLVESYQQRSAQKTLSDFRSVFHGGSATRGQNIFLRNAQVQCIRCHRVDKNGISRVGPDLSDVGLRLSREQIVESLVQPSAKIAKGFEQVTLVTLDGQVVSGIVGEETKESLTILPTNPTDQLTGNTKSNDTRGITIPITEVDVRTKTLKSAMPDGIHNQLTLAELRDLVEFLASRRKQLKNE